MRAGFAIALVLMAAMTGLAGPVHAGAAPKPETGSDVDMPFLIAPMVIDDKLVAYAYITSAVVASSPTAAIDVREKLAFIQDAYVRDVNAAPISKADDPKTIDVPGLIARFTADAKRVAGAGKVSTVKILVIKFAPLKGTGQTDTPPAPT